MLQRYLTRKNSEETNALRTLLVSAENTQPTKKKSVKNKKKK
jgi:hypothetical protein